MIKQMSHKITSLCIEKNIIANEKQDIYDYGMGLVLSSVFSLVTIMGIAIALGKALDALGFIIFFVLLRGAAGGYHSGSYLSCFIKFSLMVSVSLFLSHIILNQTSIGSAVFITGMICITAILFILLYAPVDTANKRFSDEELVFYREKSIRTVLFQGIALAMMTYLNTSLALASSFGMLMQGITLFPVLNKYK